MNSEYSIEYQLAFHEGKAIAHMESLESLIEIRYPEIYDMYKNKIRRLCEYEADMLFYKFIKDANIDLLHEFL